MGLTGFNKRRREAALKAAQNAESVKTEKVETPATKDEPKAEVKTEQKVEKKEEPKVSVKEIKAKKNLRDE